MLDNPSETDINHLLLKDIPDFVYTISRLPQGVNTQVYGYFLGVLNGPLKNALSGGYEDIRFPEHSIRLPQGKEDVMPMGETLCQRVLDWIISNSEETPEDNETREKKQIKFLIHYEYWGRQHSIHSKSLKQ